MIHTLTPPDAAAVAALATPEPHDLSFCFGVRSRTTPPARWAREAGARYIVGHPDHPFSGQLAYYDGAGFIYTPPGLGWRAHVLDEGVTVEWTGRAWLSQAELYTSALQNMSDAFSVFATPDQEETDTLIPATIIAAAVLLALLVIGFFATPALSHDWYPRQCCSDRDCFAAPGGVTATAGGWRVESSGEVVPYDDYRVHPTPPEGGGDFHTCHIGGDPKARVLCLFVPEFGA